MRNAGNLVIFTLLITGAFLYICNAIPQIKIEAAPLESEIGAAPDDLTAAGRKIFMSDHAQCLTCHSIGEDPKARCPNLEGVGGRAPGRKPGYSAAEYFVESLYSPNAFVVPGYPKNQMTPVNKPPIALTDDEILAVLAFLNTLGGTTDDAFIEQVKKAQDPWHRGVLSAEEGPAKFRPPIYPGDAARGRGDFLKQGCIACHRIDKVGGSVGPDLSAIGASQGPPYILESIIDPSAVIVRGFKTWTVIWKERGRADTRGRLVRWIPDEAHPRALVMNVESGGPRGESELDLSDATCVGDTVVEIKTDGGSERSCGTYVRGNETAGVELKVLEEGEWVERSVPAEAVKALRLPVSPMPGGFAKTMRPREVYDLLAYLGTLKGKE